MGETYDLVVAGGGPAGLMAAIAAGGAGARVLLLEKMPSPGRKLLASGSGRCNFSHAGPIEDFLSRYGGAGRFLRPALYAFDNRAASDFFRRGGVEILEAEGGKLFPASGRARDILAVLLGECRGLGVEILADSPLRALEPGEGGLLLSTPRARLSAPALVLATGGASYPGTGSTGEGWRLAASLGHRIVEPGPALAPLLYRDFPFASLAGLSLEDRALAVYRGGRRTAAGRGDILFTHRGLSGPGILDLSRSIRPGDELGIGLSGMAPAEIEALLLEGAASRGKRLVRSLLEPLGLPSRLLELLLSRAGLPEGLRAALLDREGRRRIALALSELRLPVEALGGWEEAMASRGGVERSEVDPKTMESRLLPGLYFAGEVLDVDGDTGGFNIQAALSTGYLAGLSAARALEAAKAAQAGEAS